MYEELERRVNIGTGITSLVLSPMIVVGNAMVMISLLKFKKLQTTTNMFIGSLAFSDFSLGLVTLPMYALYYFDDSMTQYKYLCLFKYSSVIFSLSSSLVNLVIIAVDRYVAILHPLQYAIWMTRKRAKCMIAGVWVYHVIICSLPSLGWNVYDEHNGLVCDFFVVLPKAYSMFTCPVTILIGLIISLILYIRIFKVALGAIKRKERRHHQFKKDTKSAKVMGLILFFFFIFWIPFMVSAASKYLNLDPHLVNVIKNLSLLLAMSNSTINPLIYCWLRPYFRTAFKALVQMLCCRRSAVNTSLFNASANSITNSKHLKTTNVSSNPKGNNKTVAYCTHSISDIAAGNGDGHFSFKGNHRPIYCTESFGNVCDEIIVHGNGSSNYVTRADVVKHNDDAITADNTKCNGDAIVADNTEQNGDAIVTNDTEQNGDAIVTDDTKQNGDAIIADNTKQNGDAKVTDDTQQNDDAIVTDDTKCNSDAIVTDDTKCNGDAKVTDDTKCNGDAIVTDDTKCNGDAKVTDNSKHNDNAIIADNMKCNCEAKIANDTKHNCDAIIADGTKHIEDAKVESQGYSHNGAEADLATGDRNGTLADDNRDVNKETMKEGGGDVDG